MRDRRGQARRSLAIDAGTIAALLALGSLLWLQRLGINDLEDAGSNEVLVARAPFGEILFRMRWLNQSPLYFLLLKLWKVFGESPLAVRSLYLVFLSAAVVALYSLARACWPDRRVAAVAGAMFAVSPIALFLARDGRMYALFVALVLWAARSAVAHLQRGRRVDATMAVVAMAAAIYTHFFALIVAAILAGFWLWQARSAEATGPRAVMLAQAALGALVAPQLARFVRLLAEPDPYGRLSLVPNAFELLRRLWRFLVLPPPGRGGWLFSPGVELLLATILFALVALGLERGGLGARRLFVPWTLGPLIVLIPFLGLLDLRERYFVFIPPVVFLLAARGMVPPRAGGEHPEPLPAARPLAAAGGFLLIAGLALHTASLLPRRHGEWVKLLRALAQVAPRNALVVMAPGPQLGIPTLAAQADGLSPPLPPITAATAVSTEEIEQAAQDGRAVAYLRHGGPATRLEGQHHAALLARGLERTLLVTHGAQAALFTRGADIGVAAETRIDPDRAALVRWATEQRARIAPASQGPGRSRRESAFAGAVVAAVSTDGALRRALVFASQRSENGGWWFGAEGDRDSVHEESAGGRTRLFWWTRAGRTTVVAWPRGHDGRRPGRVELALRQPGSARLEIWDGERPVAVLEGSPEAPRVAAELPALASAPVLLLDATGSGETPVMTTLSPGLEGTVPRTLASRQGSASGASSP